MATDSFEPPIATKQQYIQQRRILDVATADNCATATEDGKRSGGGGSGRGPHVSPAITPVSAAEATSDTAAATTPGDLAIAAAAGVIAAGAIDAAAYDSNDRPVKQARLSQETITSYFQVCAM